MFSQDDLGKCRALIKVIDQGKFEIQGAAVTTVASLLVWFKQLEQKIQSDLKPTKKEVKK